MANKVYIALTWKKKAISKMKSQRCAKLSLPTLRNSSGVFIYAKLVCCDAYFCTADSQTILHYAEVMCFLSIRKIDRVIK